MGSCWCLQAAHAYRGPLIAIGIGIGFMIVGSVPVAITFAMNSKNSATIIGVGFIGFGLLVLLPGVCWCCVRRMSTLRCCHSKQEQLRPDDEYVADDDLHDGNISMTTTTTNNKSSRVMSKVCYAIDNEHVIKSSLDRGSDLQLAIDINEEAEDDAVCIHQDEGEVILMR